MADENEVLRQNMLQQIDRLVQELKDLEEYRSEYSPGEYEASKQNTKEQMVEFSRTLEKLSTGSVTLMDELSSVKLALRAAISEAFKTPEVIALFAKKQPKQLRIRLMELERDFKSNCVSEAQFKEKKAEILIALKKLGEDLTSDEEHFVSQQSSINLEDFEAAPSQPESASDDKVIGAVQSKLKSSN